MHSGREAVAAEEPELKEAMAGLAQGLAILECFGDGVPRLGAALPVDSPRARLCHA